MHDYEADPQLESQLTTAKGQNYSQVSPGQGEYWLVNLHQ